MKQSYTAVERFVHHPPDARAASATISRNRQMIRAMEVLGLLRTNRRTVAQLSAALSVTHRTIYRDLIALQAAGFPLCREQGDDDFFYWRVLDTATVPQRMPGSPTYLQLRFSDAPAILGFVERLFQDVSALRARLQQEAV